MGAKCTPTSFSLNLIRGCLDNQITLWLIAFWIYVFWDQIYHVKDLFCLYIPPLLAMLLSWTHLIMIYCHLYAENLVTGCSKWSEECKPCFWVFDINLHEFIQQYHPMDAHLIKMGCNLVLLILLLNCFLILFLWCSSLAASEHRIFSFRVLIFLLSNPITFNFENQLFDSDIESSIFTQ